MWSKKIQGIKCGSWIENTVDPQAQHPGTCGKEIQGTGWIMDQSSPHDQIHTLLFALCKDCADKLG